MLGRVLAISRLRVRIALHSMRSGNGLLNTIGAVLMALIGLALSIGMAVGFGVMAFFAARSADPGTLPGSDQANATAICIPKWNADQPELCEQHVKAFEKVWAHRDKLGRG